MNKISERTRGVKILCCVLDGPGVKSQPFGVKVACLI